MCIYVYKDIEKRWTNPFHWKFITPDALVRDYNNYFYKDLFRIFNINLGPMKDH